MKIKQRPEDFRVEELTAVMPGDRGAFAFYVLEKRGWSTPDALQAIRRRWKLDLRRVSFGGLKDRHAWTIQYFTVFHGPQRDLTHHDVTVRYLGKVEHPYGSLDIQANRFRLVLRDLGEEEIAQAEAALAEIREGGVPNYFDDQRFGSVQPGQEFVARALVEGDFERGLRLALTAPYEHDRAAQKQEKALLRTHWGDWKLCKEKLPRGHARSLVDYLVSHPTDFRGAVARLRPDLRSLYLSAYQSYLWNRILARWLETHSRPDQLLAVPLRLGKLPMHRRLDPLRQGELAALQLPLPSARTRLNPDDPRVPLVQAVLSGEGLQMNDFRVKGIRDLFFSRGERAALCLPTDVEGESQPDEVHRGRRKLLLRFDLPRGAYATLIVKRTTQASRWIPFATDPDHGTMEG